MITCYNDKCFAYQKAQCWLLRETKDYQTECPFFKTIKEYICEEGHRKEQHEQLNQ